MLYLVIFIFAFVLFMVLIQINVVLEYQRNGWDDHLIISLFTLKGLLKFKFEIPLLDLEKSGIRFKKVAKVGKKRGRYFKRKRDRKIYSGLQKI